MRTAGKLVAYGAALAVVAGGAWGVGTAVGPLGATATTGEAHGTHGAHAAEGQAAGLASYQNGYAFVPAVTTFPVGRQEFAFRIIGPAGRPVTAFDVEHEQRLHLIVVRRDGSDFQHVHPEMDADGTWRVSLDLPEAGSYRAFADFTPTGGAATTLGADLAVPGLFQPRNPEVSRTAIVDGYQARLDGDLVPGRASTITVTFSRDGTPVTDLQPYLGAYGHLVALRGGDLGYLHVHPDGAPGDGRTASGPRVTFAVEVPSAGEYRLYLDFRHDGTVRTAEFVLAADGDPNAPATAAPAHGN